jgi:hypothetical protein
LLPPNPLAPLSEEIFFASSPVAELIADLIHRSQILSRWIIFCESLFDDPAMRSFD